MAWKSTLGRIGGHMRCGQKDTEKYTFTTSDLVCILLALQLACAFACCSSLLLWGCVGVECVDGDSILLLVVSEDAVDLGLRVGRCSRVGWYVVNGRHERRRRRR